MGTISTFILMHPSHTMTDSNNPPSKNNMTGTIVPTPGIPDLRIRIIGAG